jgi:hypothetical protein
MKHLAQLDQNNKVLNIIIAEDDFLLEGFVEYFEENPAFINGDLFDGFFYPPQPYPSWLRDNKGNWQAPTPYPTDGKIYQWVEADLNWQAI